VSGAVDPETYLAGEAAERLQGADGPLLMPTWLPEWTEDAELETVVGSTVIVIRWKVSWPETAQTRELDSDLFIEVLSTELKDGDPALTGPVRTTAVRTYVLGDSYVRGDCGGPEGPDFVGGMWDQGNRRFIVSMAPSPGCAEGFELDKALRFADSLVMCVVDEGATRCS